MFSLALLPLVFLQNGSGPLAVYDQATNSTVNYKVVIDVVANDTDPDGDLDPLSTVLVSDPVNGLAVVRSDGAVAYQSNPDWYGAETFNYTVSDLAGNVSNIATVEVLTLNGNGRPTAIYDQATCLEGGTIAIDVSANDIDLDGHVVAKTVEIYSMPHHGTVIVSSTGIVTYEPDAGWVNSTDTFTYTVLDNDLYRSNIATVEVYTTEDIALSPLIAVSPPHAGLTTIISFSDFSPNGVARCRFSLYGGGPTSTPWGDLLLTPPYGSLPPVALDGSGYGELVVSVPGDKVDRHVWLQAVDLTTLTLSNGVEVVILP